jgi:beta-fructofuranosidase
MRGSFIIALACCASLLVAAGQSAPLEDAVAVWHMGDARDSAGADSGLSANGAVKLGIALDGQDRDESLRRGGDGKAALLSGGHLLAGQGAGDELKLAGAKAMSLLIRLKDPSGKWDTSLFSKRGGHDTLVYNLFTFDLPSNGPGLDLGFELGTEKGMHQVKVPLRQIGAADGWHDVIVRYTGSKLEMYVDGVPVDSTPAQGALRRNNDEPCVIGGESSGGKVTRPFRGLIDHAALWDRALTDEEVTFLSGGAEAVAKRRKEVDRERQAHEQELAAKIAADPQRPAYHFLPPRNWMNDPNGLIHINGEYHLFYQYNPFGPEWGHMTWGHAVSKDLVHWKHLPHALHPDKPYDKDGVFSGCAVNHNGVATIVYTGTQPEVQAVATAKDNALIEWEKHPANPVIPAPPKDLKTTGFRDPCVWNDAASGTWIMVVGSGIKDVGGAILLYRSKDLVQWDYAGPAVVGDKSKTGTMWECPQLFPLGDSGKWILVLSPIPLDRAIHLVGTWDNAAGKFTAESQGETDLGGTLYAPQLFRDENGRLLMFGWLRERRKSAGAAGWQGVQSLPRVVTLGKDGRVHFEPAEEVKALRGRHTRVENVEVMPEGGGALKEVAGDCLEIVAEIQPGEASHVGVKVRRSPGGEEETLIVYDRTAKTLSVDRSHSSTDAGAEKSVKSAPFELAEGEPLRLRVFVDRSVIEVFANGHTCLTSRVYPSRGDSTGVDLLCRGGKVTAKALDAYELKSIW